MAKYRLNLSFDIDVSADEEEEMSEEEHVAQSAWPFPQGGLDDQDTEIVAFVEPEQKAA